MTSTTTAPSSVEDARAALNEAERELSALTAAAVEGVDVPTGATYAAAHGAVIVGRDRLRGAMDRAALGDTDRARRIADEIAAGYAEQDAAKVAARDERAAAGYPSLSDGAGFLITQDGPRPTHAESLIGAER